MAEPRDETLQSMVDLHVRLRVEEERLTDLRIATQDACERERLHDRRAGVRLAITYVEEYLPSAPPSENLNPHGPSVCPHYGHRDLSRCSICAGVDS